MRLPRSLFGRVTLILVCGLVLSHGLSYGLMRYQQIQVGKAGMLAALGNDVATAVAVLERVPAHERASWLGRLERRNYRFVLGGVRGGAPLHMPLADEALQAVQASLSQDYRVGVSTAPDPRERRIDLHLALADGTPLTVILVPAPMRPPSWVVPAIVIQLAVLVLCGWWAVRLVTRPLERLARAADQLSPVGQGAALPEDGPAEVARAASAFNAMQDRIAGFLEERMHILASVAHDLQTPITRLRLRADLLDDATQRDRMLADLGAMQALVEEGIAYARDARGLTEQPVRTDLDALLASVVYDYRDAGHAVDLHGGCGTALQTRPQALRRILTNLIDNALKFGRAVEVHGTPDDGAGVEIAVLDRGPGIDPAEYEAVLQPFYRIETSRNRNTGGTGLGLAIARQLAEALGGTLTLAQRDGGGLAVRVRLPHV